MIIQEIKHELKKHSDSEEKKKRIRWEKQYQEMAKLYGIPFPIVRRLSSKFFLKVKKKTKQEILQSARVAHTLDEACKLHEVSFEYVTDMNKAVIFRKRK